MTSTFESNPSELASSLASEDALREFVTAWENCSLPAKAWTHAAHLTAAAYYAFDHSPEDCYLLMKTGILRFNACTGVENTPDRGYHETLTRFWAKEVHDFVTGRRTASRLEAARAAVAEFGNDRQRWRRCYTFDVLKDRKARREWVPPDGP